MRRRIGCLPTSESVTDAALAADQLYGPSTNLRRSSPCPLSILLTDLRIVSDRPHRDRPVPAVGDGGCRPDDGTDRLLVGAAVWPAGSRRCRGSDDARLVRRPRRVGSTLYRGLVGRVGPSIITDPVPEELRVGTLAVIFLKRDAVRNSVAKSRSSTPSHRRQYNGASSDNARFRYRRLLRVGWTSGGGNDRTGYAEAYQ